MRKEKTMEKGKIDHDINEEGVREKKRKEKEKNSNIYFPSPLTKSNNSRLACLLRQHRVHI